MMMMTEIRRSSRPLSEVETKPHTPLGTPGIPVSEADVNVGG